MRLVFLGPPGSGKGTQATLLSQEWGLAHISSGDLFRQAVERGDELGMKVKGFMERGELVPDDIVIALILNSLEGQASGFILDGFPRTLEQAKSLDEALSREGKPLDLAVYIHISSEEAMRRLSGRLTCPNCQASYNILTSPPKGEGRCDHCGSLLAQRPDDREEVIKRRYEVFLTQTAPLVKYYKDRGKLIEINGEQDIEKVKEDIKRALRWG